MFVVAAVVGFAGAVVVALTVATEACVAPVEVIPPDGLSTVFAALTAGVEFDRSSEGYAAVTAGVAVACSSAATSRA